MIPEPTVTAQSYTVSCLPEDDINRFAFTIEVQYRGGGLWAVKRYSAFLGKDGTWSYGYSWRDGTQEPVTDEDFAEYTAGEEQWRDQHRFDHDTALRLACEQAPLIRVNGHTVEDALGWSR